MKHIKTGIAINVINSSGRHLMVLFSTDGNHSIVTIEDFDTKEVIWKDCSNCTENSVKRIHTTESGIAIVEIEKMFKMSLENVKKLIIK